MKTQRSFLAVLEDDLDGRVPAMATVASALGLSFISFDASAPFLAWLRANLEATALVSLDHDLGPSRLTPNGREDPGTGMDVADFLSTLSPQFPLIVHSANPRDAPRMCARLQDAGWSVVRVVPAGQAALDWIEGSWRREVAALV